MAYVIGGALDSSFSDSKLLSYNGNSNQSWLYGNDTDGRPALSSDTMDSLEFEVVDWLSATNLKVNIALSNTIVETVIVPSSAGIGVISVPLSGLGAVQGAVYRISIYSENGENFEIRTNSSSSVTLRFYSATGNYSSPSDLLPNGSFDSFNEIWWAVQNNPAPTGPSIDDIDGDNEVRAGQQNVVITGTDIENATSVTLGGQNLPIV